MSALRHPLAQVPAQIDEVRFRNLCGGSPDTFRELCTLYLSVAHDHERELREALAVRDWERAADIAHAFKGSLSVVCAPSAQALVAKFERACVTGNAPRVHAAHRDLCAALAQVAAEVRQIGAHLAPGARGAAND